MEKKLNEMENEKELEKFIDQVDDAKVEKIKKEIEDYTKELQNKEYAIAIDMPLLVSFKNFMSEKVQWRAKEALGVKEIMKRIDACINGKDIKDNVVYFTNLEIEASHYFLMKWESVGNAEVDEFITLWKTFEETLMLIRQDNEKMEDLKKDLTAAEQGIESE